MDLNSRASSLYWCPWCVSDRCAGYARGFALMRPGPPPPRSCAGGHHPHCNRPRGPPPAHFPSDPAFACARVPPGLVVGAVCCMLGCGARLVMCGNSIYNLAAVHPRTCSAPSQRGVSKLSVGIVQQCLLGFLRFALASYIYATAASCQQDLFGLQGRL